MATELKIPDLGEGIEGGDIVTLHVAVGESVTEGQALFEIETGKATVDVPSPAAGTLSSLTVEEGDKVTVGDVFGTMEGGDAAPAAEEATAPAEEAPAAPEPESTPAQEEAPASEPAPSQGGGSIDIVIPNLGEGVDGGDVVTIHVAAGDSVEKDQPILELETGKATVDVPAPADGVIGSIDLSEGDRASVGDVVGKMEAEGAASVAAPAPAASEASPAPAASAPEAPKASAPAPAAPAVPAADRLAHAPVPASPSVRKFAREIGVEIIQVPGSGPRGRISMDDVKAWSKQRHQQAAEAPAAAGPATLPSVELPDFTTFGEVDVQDMPTIRKMTVEHMRNCWSSIPHVTQCDDADVTDLEALRKTFQPKAEAAGAKLTMTAMLIKILGSALKAFPNFNASIDTENEQIIYKKYVNVGCAVDTPKGLVVPVLRDIPAKNMIEISSELGEIAGKMRDGKITPALLQGGCITISNLGGLSGKHFTPIVNGPEVAILGVGRATMKPVWQDGQFVPRMMMPLSLSYDHRLIDGADGTRFLRWIVDAIEQPLLISLEG